MSDSTDRDGYSEPAVRERCDGAERHAWHPRRRTYLVLGAEGIVEEHTGIGLRLRDVVAHLCRPDAPTAALGSDLIVMDAESYRARVLIYHVLPVGGGGRHQPRAVRMWSDHDGHERAGKPFPYIGGDDDGRDDDD